MKNLFYKISYFFIYIFSFAIGAMVNAQALQSGTVSGMGAPAKTLAEQSGFDVANGSIGAIMAKVLTTFLSLLAIIFIVLIVLAGYNWMTAGGEEQKVTKAKDSIQKAVIGLIIIMSAYVITAFVFNNLPAGGGSSIDGGAI